MNAMKHLGTVQAVGVGLQVIFAGKTQHNRHGYRLSDQEIESLSGLDSGLWYHMRWLDDLKDELHVQAQGYR